MVGICEAARSPALLPTCETVGLAKPVQFRVDEIFVPKEMIDVPCRACGHLYLRGVAVIYLEAGDGPELGEICPICVSEG